MVGFEDLKSAPFSKMVPRKQIYVISVITSYDILSLKVKLNVIVTLINLSNTKM